MLMGPQKLSLFRVAAVIAITWGTGTPETIANCCIKSGSSANGVTYGPDAIKIRIFGTT